MFQFNRYPLGPAFLLLWLQRSSFAFTTTTLFPIRGAFPISSATSYSNNNNSILRIWSTSTPAILHTTLQSQRFSNNGKDEEEEEEKTRLKILSTRRQTIRSVLKNAEDQRNYRIENDLVPEIDPETGKPIKSDSKLALTLTAFVVAAGAVTLRVGGRAALVSAVGLDYITLTCKGSVDPLIIAIKNIITITRYRGDD
jgi:hypothetical protein